MNPLRSAAVGILTLARQHLVVLPCRWLTYSKYIHSLIIGGLVISITTGCNQTDTSKRGKDDDQTETSTNDDSASVVLYTADSLAKDKDGNRSDTSTNDYDSASVPPPHTATITLDEVGEIELFMTDEAILSLPHTVRIDSRGNIYWAESRPPNYVFNSGGVFIGSIGACGAGPGELTNIETFNIDSGSNFHVFDASISRISQFSSDFSFVRNSTQLTVQAGQS